MLSVVREWFSRNPVQPEPEEQQPFCFVAAMDEPLRDRFADMIDEHGLRVETFGEIPAMLEAAAEQKPDLVVFEVGFGSALVDEAMKGMAALPKRPAVQLISAFEVKSYEQLCAVGQAKLTGDQAGLKVTSAMPPPFQPDAVRKVLQNHGLLRKTGKPTVTLRQAIENNWLELWYQPKIELATKRLAGAEGLIRLRHPDLGVLPPGAFLPGASDEDMLKMTEQVISAALRDFEDCAALGAPVLLSVNTPVSALTKLPIADMLREARPQTPNWPGLILEVTEDEIVNDLSVASKVAEELRTHNCSLAIDDFGAGYSSLSRLRQLPFSELKIDRSYVTNCDRDRTNAGLCETIVELAKRFGLKTVAEGIETMHESHKLQAIGCDIGQGYLYSKPLSKADFLATLRRRIVHRTEAPPQRLGPVRFNARA